MKDERTIYTERTPWPGFVTAILWGAVVLSCYPILAGWDHDLPARVRWPLVGAILAFVAAVQTVVGGLTVKVRETGLLLHLGSVPVIRKAVPYSTVVSLESVAYRPIREFGGWGVRGSGNRRAWTARGDRAVKLELTDHRELLVGSDHPQRLEERIRTTGGDLLGRAAPGGGR
jgi:hypothetical protein